MLRPVSPSRPSEYEALAREFLPAEVYDYFAGGAEDEATLADNRAAFARIRLVPRVLRSVVERSLETPILDATASMPILLAPMAMQRLLHEDGELAAARAARNAGIVTIASTLATTSIEDIAAACRPAPVWFQLYVYKDRGLTGELVRRAEMAGASALVLTVDAPIFGRRERDLQSGFRLPDGLHLANLHSAGLDRFPETSQGSGLVAYGEALLDASVDWNDLSRLTASTSLPVVVKGILHPDDARLAVSHGAAAVFVSNHGGRQLDGAAATIDALEGVIDAVAGRAEVYLDGGVRRGTDVVKALAIGARAVAIGRPIAWGLAAAGERGVARVLAALREELDAALALCGARRPADLGRDLLF